MSAVRDELISRLAEAESRLRVRQAAPVDPALVRYLDPATGRIGSSIATKVSGAGDDDDLEADYYTSLNVWHTPLATGPLEVYLAFEFTASTYSGSVTDESGFSDAIVSQFARARLFTADAQDPVQRETQESLVYNFIDTVWGDDLYGRGTRSSRVIGTGTTSRRQPPSSEAPRSCSRVAFGI